MLFKILFYLENVKTSQINVQMRVKEKNHRLEQITKREGGKEGGVNLTRMENFQLEFDLSINLL